jgi:hypothetical protein
MPSKTRVYPGTKFQASDIREAAATFDRGADAGYTTYFTRVVRLSPQEGWEYDSDQEFYAKYREDIPYARLDRNAGQCRFMCKFEAGSTTVEVKLPSSERVEAVFDRSRTP